MKCPHCGYEHGWSNENLCILKGKQGDFYKLPVRMERESTTHPGYKKGMPLFGCPSCMKTFIEDY